MDHPASASPSDPPPFVQWPWPRPRPCPLIYEVNAWVFLEGLRREGPGPGDVTLTLGEVPESALDEIAATGADYLWLMGVWERSPAGRQQALNHPGLAEEYRRALPDATAADVAGSPYAVYQYQVAAQLGGETALRRLRARLETRGIGLILDLVPNHVAIDHPWLTTHPDAFVRGSEGDLRAHPEAFFRHAPTGAIFAHGRDPHFAPWTDTAQLDAQSVTYRGLLTRTLLWLTELCDGVRCDMAMLLVQRVFARTWGGHVLGGGSGAQDDAAVDRVTTELWPVVTAAVRERRPSFLFLAEVYWDMEAELQAQGFQYTYDKRLYDRLCHGNVDGVRDHLNAELAYQQRSLRFIENHDEPRAVIALGPARSQAAAVLTLTLPGGRLLHEGQMEGRAIKLPVQLGRRPHEAADSERREFYRRLLHELRAPVFHSGTYYALASRPFGGADRSHEQLLSHAWVLSDALRIVVINWGPARASARLLFAPFPDGTRWRFRDALNDHIAPEFTAEELRVGGLPIFLDAYAAHLFVVEACA